MTIPRLLTGFLYGLLASFHSRVPLASRMPLTRPAPIADEIAKLESPLAELLNFRATRGVRP